MLVRAGLDLVEVELRKNGTEEQRLLCWEFPERIRQRADCASLAGQVRVAVSEDGCLSVLLLSYP